MPSSSSSSSDNDTTSPFHRIPGTAQLLSPHPDLITRVPPSLTPKLSTEDSLFAETFRTPRTLRSCLLTHRRPARAEDDVAEVTVLFWVGDGVNGHAGILHGGVTAVLVDESMGMLQACNVEREGLRRRGKMGKVGKGEEAEVGEGEGLGSFTADLRVRYLRPVRTPGAIAVVVKRARKEGRKEWLVAELKQWHGVGEGEDEEGEVVVCATGEALFVTPRAAGGSRL